MEVRTSKSVSFYARWEWRKVVIVVSRVSSVFTSFPKKEWAVLDTRLDWRDRAEHLNRYMMRARPTTRISYLRAPKQYVPDTTKHYKALNGARDGALALAKGRCGVQQSTSEELNDLGQNHKRLRRSEYLRAQQTTRISFTTRYRVLRAPKHYETFNRAGDEAWHRAL